MIHGKRLLEGCLPIEAISAEASREKSVRKGHISTLHLWWTKRFGVGASFLFEKMNRHRITLGVADQLAHFCEA